MDAADGRRPRRGPVRDRSSWSNGRCSRRSARARGRCCWSTSWTAPTTSSRRSCWRCCREFAVTIPEVGRIAAEPPPAVIVTSNRTRELHDALEAPLPLPLDRPPGAGARGGDRARPRAARRRGARARGRRRRSRGCARWTWRSAPAWPRRSTGRTRSRSWGPSGWTPRPPRDTLGAVVKDHEDQEMVAAPSRRGGRGRMASRPAVPLAAGRLRARPARGAGCPSAPAASSTFVPGGRRARARSTATPSTGRAASTMVASRDDLETYDEVFDEWFRSLRADAEPELSLELDLPRRRPRTSSSATSRRTIEVRRRADRRRAGSAPARRTSPPRAMKRRSGSSRAAVEVLRSKSFAYLSEEERQRVAEMIRQLAVQVPIERTRRMRSANKGSTLDVRRTLRRSLRTQGEPFDRAWRARRTRDAAARADPRRRRARWRRTRGRCCSSGTRRWRPAGAWRSSASGRGSRG